MLLSFLHFFLPLSLPSFFPFFFSSLFEQFPAQQFSCCWIEIKAVIHNPHTQGLSKPLYNDDTGKAYMLFEVILSATGISHLQY